MANLKETKKSLFTDISEEKLNVPDLPESIMKIKLNTQFIEAIRRSEMLRFKRK